MIEFSDKYEEAEIKPLDAEITDQILRMLQEDQSGLDYPIETDSGIKELEVALIPLPDGTFNLLLILKRDSVDVNQTVGIKQKIIKKDVTQEEIFTFVRESVPFLATKTSQLLDERKEMRTLLKNSMKKNG